MSATALHKTATFAGRAAALTLALICLLAAVWGVYNLPFFRLPLAVALAAYAALLVRWRWAWLIVLPAILPVLDLAPWSGRFYFTEFDFFVLLTLAVGYGLHGAAATFAHWFSRRYLVVALFALSVALSVGLRLVPWPAVAVDSFATYLSPWNALRVAKGFAAAWLLLPLLNAEWRQDARLTGHRLITGILVGLGLAIVGVLWERGVLLELVTARNIYGLLASFLDFSGTYRVTGLFSGMHVGGEAIDGYLALAAPWTLYPVLFARRPWLKVLGLLLFAGGVYALMVTFSRGLYAGFAVSLIGIFLLMAARNFRQLKTHGLAVLAGIAIFLIFTALLAALYSRGGFEPLILGIFLVALGTSVGLILPPRLRPYGLIALGFAALFVGLRIYGDIMHSKWTETSSQLALPLTVVAVTVLAFASALAARPLFRDVGRIGAASIVFLAALFWGGVIPPLSGEQAQTRFATVGKDFAARAEHWRRALAAIDPSLATQVLGNGVGSFPQLFFSYMLSTDFPLATYSLGRADDIAYLRLGGGDFNIIQRLPMAPDTTYRLSARLRAETGAPNLTFKICHKHLLYSERYVPQCQSVNYNFKRRPAAGWVEFSADLQSGNLGRHGLLYWPVALMLHNGQGIVDIAEVRLIAPNGRDLIANGAFSAGLDRWFLVSDFEHLAWHAKNIYLHFFIEQGLFGLAAFMALAGLALASSARAAWRGDPVAIILLPTLLSFLLVGLFGTLIDMPPVATLFYLLVFAGLGISPRDDGETPSQ